MRTLNQPKYTTMKKLFTLAATVAVIATLFTACKNNNGNNPTEPEKDGVYYAKDYVGQQWVTDSTRVGDELTGAPHAYIYVKSETMVEINGYEDEYSIEGNILTLRPNDEYPMPLTILSADKDHAKLSMPGFGGDDVPGIVYMTRVEEPQGNDLEVNMANIAGKWRMMFFIRTETYLDSNNQQHTSVLKHAEPGESLFDFRNDGTLTATNSLDAIWGAEPMTGWWELQGNKMAYATGSTEYPAVKPDQISDDSWSVVTKLTQNVMKLTYTQTAQGGYSMSYMYYFVRKK